MKLQECEGRNPFLRFGVHRGPTSKLKGSLGLRLTWSSEKQKKKRERCEKSGNRSDVLFHSAVYPPSCIYQFAKVEFQGKQTFA